MRKFGVICTAALLAACGGDGAGNTATAGNAVAQVAGEPWRCEDGRTLTVAYGEDGDATLGIGGKAFVLGGVTAASGAKYEIAQGPTPGKRMAWWSKGDEAMLIERPILSPEGADDETVVTCRRG